MRKTFLVCLIALLSACDIGTRVANNRGTTIIVDTNAYFYGEILDTGAVRKKKSGNDLFLPDTANIIVDNDTRRYGFVFSCPSTNEAVPHRVYLYYATVPEMNSLVHLCKSSNAQTDTAKVYGTIGNVAVNNGEKVVLALDSRGTTIDALEAYAIEVVKGTRDVVGYKGVSSVGSVGVTPDMFVISRRQPMVASSPIPINVEFSPGNGTTSGAPSNSNTITVTPPATGANWKAQLGFRSENRTYLPLVEATASSLTYRGVPKYVHDQNGIILGNATTFRRDTEGHEFSATITDAQQRAIAEYRRFFDDPADFPVVLPGSTVSGASLAAGENDDGLLFTLAWPSFTDEVLGQSRLYHWTITGTPNEAELTTTFDTIITQLEWHIFITPGWLNSASGGNTLLVEPVSMPTEETTDGEVVEIWKKEWNFKKGTAVSWTFDAITTSLDAETLVSHFADSRYFADLAYVKHTQYGN